MSENSTLISYNGKITREELAQVPTPPATETHQPIAHHRVVEALVESMSFRHIGVVAEEYACLLYTSLVPFEIGGPDSRRTDRSGRMSLDQCSRAHLCRRPSARCT